jgi:hypothetical protein
MWVDREENNMSVSISYHLIPAYGLQIFSYIAMKAWHSTLFEVMTTELPPTNSVAFSPQANYTDWMTAACQRNLVYNFVDRRVSRGQRGGYPTLISVF